MNRQDYFREYYQNHRDKLLTKSRAYYHALKSDPATYMKLLESERLRKRRKFGWVRTYRIKRGL